MTLWRVTAMVGFSLTGVACFDIRADRRVLVDTPFELTRTVRVVEPANPLRAVGPFNEVCLGVPADYGLGSNAGDSNT